MFKTAKDAHKALVNKEISAKELLDGFYKKIDERLTLALQQNQVQRQQKKLSQI